MNTDSYNENVVIDILSACEAAGLNELNAGMHIAFALLALCGGNELLAIETIETVKTIQES